MTKTTCPQPATARPVRPEAPILLFDSGVGGLSVLAELRRALPQASVVYGADLAGLPYGEKDEAQIAARVAGLLGRMSERFSPRLACIACNTASTIALGMVREVLEIPIVGTVPAIKPAAALSRTGTIGLLGTEATIRQPYVDRLEAEFASDKRLLRHGAGALVAAAEARLRGEPLAIEAIDGAIDGLLAMEGAAQMDTLVLACTHFPLLSDLLDQRLEARLGRRIALLHGADGIARRIAALCEGQAFASPARLRFVHTGPQGAASALAPALRARGFEAIEPL